MKQHIPKRTISTNPFNKDRFKGNNEIIQDWDLDTRLYIFEPESLADTRKTKLLRDGDELDDKEVDQIYGKTTLGGRVNIHLIPFDEQPFIDVKILSDGGDSESLEGNRVFTAISNIPKSRTKTKRFYIKEKDLPKIEGEIPEEVEIYMESNDSDVINTDDTIKQTSWTFEKFEKFVGADGSFYSHFIFWLGIGVPKNIKYISSEITGGSAAIGEMIIADISNEPIEKEILFLENDFAWINDAGVLSKSDIYLDAHYLSPNVSSNSVKFRAPWCAEYLYAKHQYKGKYKVQWENDGGSEASNPAVIVDSSYVYDELPTYTRYFNKEAFGGSDFREKLGEVFLPYIARFSLPSLISSHGVYVTKKDFVSANEVGGLVSAALGKLVNIFGNTGEDDSSESGLRIHNNTGIWTKNSTIFTWDFAFDPTGWVLVYETFDFWLSDIVYGKFYRSEGYREMLNGIVNGNTWYNGSEFYSELGILKDISHEELQADINNTKEIGNTMVLFPYSVTELAGGDDFESENLLNRVPEPAPTYPKWDAGLADFTESKLRVNSTSPFTGLTINTSLYTDDEARESKFVLELNEVIDVARYSINYYAGKKLKVRYFDENKNLISIDEINTEHYDGRIMSGGTNIIHI